MRILVVNLLFWLFIGGLSSCNSGTDPHTLRLKLLADTQQRSNDLMLNDIGELINRIQADVESHGNSPHDIALLNEADTLLVRTKATAGRIRNMQVAVLSKLGRRNYFQDLESHVLVEKVLLQAGVPTSADSLYFHLQSFTAYAKQLDPQALKSSWLLPEDAGYLTPASRLLDGPTNFRDFYFKGTT
ncbi:MAG TPA: hypothetical protein VK364_13560, partial [Hymenobacter sp.]|nr:hypothetical protein [Hymenobacter sp.]